MTIVLSLTWLMDDRRSVLVARAGPEQEDNLEPQAVFFFKRGSYGLVCYCPPALLQTVVRYLDRTGRIRVQCSRRQPHGTLVTGKRSHFPRRRCVFYRICIYGSSESPVEKCSVPPAAA